MSLEFFQCQIKVKPQYFTSENSRVYLSEPLLHVYSLGFCHQGSDSLTHEYHIFTQSINYFYVHIELSPCYV
jgi:hypothetical protein